MAVIYTPIFLIVAFIVWFFIRPHLVAQGWKRLAEELGLTYTAAKGFLGMPKPGELSGTYRGRTIKQSLYVEIIPRDDGDADWRREYIQTTIALKKPVSGKVVLQKFSAMTKLSPGEGIPLPDKKFSDRYTVTASEPRDFAMKVFHSENLRKRVSETVGRRRSFYLGVEKRGLHFSSLGQNWFLPHAAIEWRTGVMKEMINTLCEVAEAAEAAPEAPGTMEHLRSEAEAQAFPTLGNPEGAVSFGRYGKYVTRPGGAVIMGIALALLLLIVVATTNDDIVMRQVCFSCMAPFILYGIFASIRPRERMFVFESGLTYKRGGKTTAYRWEDIETIWQQRRRTMPFPVYTLEMKDGKKLRLKGLMEHEAQLMKGILRGHWSTKKQELLSQHENGQPLDFGPFCIEGKELVCDNGQGFTLRSISNFTVDPRGMILVTASKKTVSPGRVSLRDMPNFHLMESLVQSLGGKKVKLEEKKAAKPAPVQPSGDYKFDPRFRLIVENLVQLMKERKEEFVIFSVPVSEHFVQFLKVGNDGVLFDLPMVGLDDETYARAVDFLDRFGSGLWARSGRDGIYQVEFLGDAAGIDEAAGLAVAVLVEVFGLGEEIQLGVEYGKQSI